LGTKDDFIGAIRFDAELNSRTLRIIKEEGLTGEAAQRTKEQLRTLYDQFDSNQGLNEFVGIANNLGVDESVATSAYTQARKALAETNKSIYRDDLGETAKRIQGVINSVPGGQVIVPFFKTPVKLMWDRYFMERGLGAVLTLPVPNSKINKAWKQGGASRDMVMGTLATSGFLHYIGYSLAVNGKVMGALPKTKGERDLLLNNGVIENSININGKWVDIGRLDPAASFLLMPSNIMSLYNANEDLMGEQDELDLTEAMRLSVQGMAELMTNKTWTQNISDFIDVFTSERPDKVETYLRNLTASAVPSGIKWGVELVNAQEYKQSADTLVESVMRRVGASTKPSLDIFGEKIKSDTKYSVFLPVKQTEQQDKVSAEMLRVGAYVNKPDFNFKGVRLTPQQRYRLLEIMGESEIKKGIENFINSNMYKNLPDTELRPVANSQQATKSGVIKLVYSQYIEQAKEKLMLEDVELEAKVKDKMLSKYKESPTKAATKMVLPQIKEVK
jgi:hypothetical protein